jgi:hypothetical protein
MDAHRTVWILAGWLTFPAMAFFLWFAVQLRAFLRLAPQIDDGLPTYALVGALGSVILNIAAAAIAIALAFHPSADLGATLRPLYDVYNILGELFVFPLVVMVFAVSHSGRRHASLPEGLVWLGYLTALLLTLSTFSVFFTTGAFALASPLTLFTGLVPFTLWMIWVSVVLIRVPRAGAGVVVAAEIDVSTS